MAEGMLSGMSPYLMQMGLGLLKGNNWQEGLAGGVEGSMAEMDRRRKQAALMKILGGGQQPAPAPAQPPAPQMGGDPTSMANLEAAFAAQSGPTAPPQGMMASAPQGMGMMANPAAPTGINPNAPGPRGGNFTQTGIGGLFSPQQAGMMRELVAAGLLEGPDMARVMLSQAFQKPGERKIVKGVDGRNYYADTKEPVLPGIEKQPEETSGLREYAMAKQQGYQGTFLDYKRELAQAGRAVSTNNVNVNAGSSMPQVGTIPQGWELRNVDDAWRMVPIEGGPADREIAGEEAAAVNAKESQRRTADIVLEDIGRIREKVTQAPWFSPTTGLGGVILGAMPGSRAADVGSLTQTIRANIGFDRLQQMRESSPTGGALGNVTVQELARLESVLGNLEQSQSEPQFLENLERLNGVYMDIIHGAGKWQQEAQPNALEGDGMPAPQTPQEMMKLAPGTKYKAPDGSIRIRQ